MRKLIMVFCLLTLAVPLTAQAYVGPGLGLGALAVIIGILLSIFIAVLAIVWYPIKRRRAARKAAKEGGGRA